MSNEASKFKGKPLTMDRLEYENGRLVKIDGMRYQYMSGDNLIALVGALAANLKISKDGCDA